MKHYQTPEILITQMPAFEDILSGSGECESIMTSDDLFPYSDTISTLMNEGKLDQVIRYYQ